MTGSDARVNGEACRGGRKPTASTSPATPDKAGRAVAGVGGIRSSDDAVPNLWFGENTEERRDAACSAAKASDKGRGDGPQGLPTLDKVRALQVTLYRKAKAAAKHRFWSLYGEVQRMDVLEEAWRRVAENGGAAGVDGVSIAEIREQEGGAQELVEEIRRELKARCYRPWPVLRVMIPKANGRLRPLGIPTVKDRVVQMAVYLVLMPIFEADFHPRSYGFRPKRNAHQAMEAIREAMRMGKTEVVDADIARYFDQIEHGRLLRRVARRVSDGSILQLLKSWLRCVVVSGGEDESPGAAMGRSKRGTPQGGVISPLLANIYLHPLDGGVNDECRQKPRMIRYADDLVILCRPGEGKQMKERLARWLEKQGLKLNEEKSRVLDSREAGFEFLGFALCWRRSRNGSEYVHAEPSARSQQKLRDRWREMTPRSSTWRKADEMVGELNATTRGWGNYFAYGHYGEVFGKMRRFTNQRLRHWLWRKHGQRGSKYQQWPDHMLREQYRLYQLPSAELGHSKRSDKGTRKAGCGKTARPV